MRRGQRPSRHVRRVRTKYGPRPTRINPHLRRFRWPKSRRRTPVIPMSPHGQRYVPSTLESRQDPLRTLEQEARKNAQRYRGALDAIAAEQAAAHAKEEALAAERQRIKSLTATAAKSRSRAYDDLVEATEAGVARAEGLAVDVFGKKSAMGRLEAGITPYATEVFEAGLGSTVPVRMSRRDQVQHALDLARKTHRPDLIKRAQEAVTQLHIALSIDEDKARARRAALTRKHGAETYERLRRKATLTKDELMTLKLLDPNYWRPADPTLKEAGFIEDPKAWVWDKEARKLIPRSELLKALESLSGGEWSGVIPDPESLQAKSTDELNRLKRQTELEQAAIEVKVKPLLEAEAREAVGISHRGEKRSKRATRDESEEFEKQLANPKTVIKLRIVDDKELPP